MVIVEKEVIYSCSFRSYLDVEHLRITFHNIINSLNTEDSVLGYEAAND